MRNKKIFIKGMHCASCEVLLEKELKKIPGLKHCHVNHRKGEAQLRCKRDVPLSELEEAIKNCGYELGDGEIKPEKKHKNTLYDYFMFLIIAMLILVVVFVAKDLELTRFFPNVGENVGIVVALLLGVVASLSTCLALTGGIVMSFGSMVHVHDGRKHHFMSRAVPHIYFHIGRIVGFMLLGGLLGLIGSRISYSLSFTGYLTIAISFVMLYIGLQILDIVPNITKLGFHLPKFLSKGVHSLEKADHHLAPILIGILTFFLPCGFTQSMQLASVASGSFISGALIMGAFAIGTAPVLLSIGIGSTYAKEEKMKFLMQFIGVFIILFSLYSFNSGLILSGSPVTLDSWRSAKDAIVSEIDNDVQVVKMDIDWTFSDNEFCVKKGVPVRWEINGINVSGCSNEIVIPSLDIRKSISKGKNIIEFTPTQEGVIPFSCWMGMIGGKFIVE
ncbi:sulfite exporter TauE/SafE family protein [Patescibacteria group bacterium]|nr:sulfite exporter TauE/SafE family protein [Patescibacteria group bacterium]MBU1682439.1 sulfite exporter TauE/SafE family protein [Patescibacteria group bacterium]MBU1934444.1 sulfite exporter TauE/SafE family protein [Patescibacteria group bacterium]